jgi:hypothetical protein
MKHSVKDLNEVLDTHKECFNGFVYEIKVLDGIPLAFINTSKQAGLQGGIITTCYSQDIEIPHYSALIQVKPSIFAHVKNGEVGDVNDLKDSLSDMNIYELSEFQ